MGLATALSLEAVRSTFGLLANGTSANVTIRHAAASRAGAGTPVTTALIETTSPTRIGSWLVSCGWLRPTPAEDRTSPAATVIASFMRSASAIGVPTGAPRYSPLRPADGEVDEARIGGAAASGEESTR